MSDPVRIAMLGSGFVAEFYMQGLATVNGQRVVVNFSRPADRAADFARRWGIPEHSTDLDAVIGGWDADLFVIALPNEEHLPAALALAKAGRNQVCTKPLGRRRTAKITPCWSSAWKASASLTASCPGPLWAGSICAMRFTDRRGPSSPTSRAKRPLRASPRNRRDTWWKRPISILAGRARCRKRRSLTGTRPR